MANEITMTTGLSITKNSTTATMSVTKQRSLTNDAKAEFTQSFDTTGNMVVFPAALIADGISAVSIKNLNATNAVSLSHSSTFSAATIYSTIRAGEAAGFPVNKAAATDPSIWIQAAASSVTCEIVAAGIST